MTNESTIKYGHTLDAVIVNYRTPEDLVRCVRSFVEVQWEVPTRLAVVNVDPTEADHEAWSDVENLLEVPNMGLFFETNVGYSGACNGAAYALLECDPPGKTVAFFNADVEFRPGVLDECHWRLHNDKQLAVIGPRQVDRAGRITHAGIFGTNTEPQLRGWHKPDAGQFNEYRDDAVSVSGAAYFVKRKVWDELSVCEQFRDVAPQTVGAFLPTPHYYEETWFSYHARAHGWKVAYHGGVCMLHEWHQASPQGASDAQLARRSRKQFREACQHHGIESD